VLLTTRGSVPLHRFAFAAGDTLLLGRESAGVPDFVHERADARVRIPMRAGARSLNIAVAGAIALAEALRQTGALETLGGGFDHMGEQADI
jgi:tRNA (cytidine/uridine-2'-O-)-methyltransferase